VPRRAVLLAIAAVLALLACAGDKIPVSTNFDPLVRFPAAATFVWDEAASTLPKDPAIDPAATEALIKDVVNEAFAARNYRAVERDANYRLSYQYFVNEYFGPDTSRAVGSLSLFLAEAGSGRRVWAGFGRAEIHPGLTPEERRKRLGEAMHHMLKDFPPSQR
jgi:hypothetical protein